MKYSRSMQMNGEKTNVPRANFFFFQPKGNGQFSDDEERHGPLKVGLLTIQQPKATSSPRIFY